MATKRMKRRTRRRSCKNGKLKRPVRTKKGGKRRCKKTKSRRKRNRKKSYKFACDGKGTNASIDIPNLNDPEFLNNRYGCNTGVFQDNGNTKSGISPENNDHISCFVFWDLMYRGGNSKGPDGDYRIKCKENLLVLTIPQLEEFINNIQQTNFLQDAFFMDNIEKFEGSIGQHKANIIELIWEKIERSRGNNVNIGPLGQAQAQAQAQAQPQAQPQPQAHFNSIDDMYDDLENTQNNKDLHSLNLRIDNFMSRIVPNYIPNIVVDQYKTYYDNKARLESEINMIWYTYINN